jgi:hypothetical protein
MNNAGTPAPAIATLHTGLTVEDVDKINACCQRRLSATLIGATVRVTERRGKGVVD